MSKTPLRWLECGTLDYRDALRLQDEIREKVAATECDDTVLFCDHPPVITLGRSAERSHVIADEQTLRDREIECIRVGRGGDVTYHGPGQLICYPIRSVGRRVRSHVEGMAAAVLAYLDVLGIDAKWRSDRPGIWTSRGKIAAIGVEVRGGVTTHGLALNIDPRLDDYRLILPCGHRDPVTSIAECLEDTQQPKWTCDQPAVRSAIAESLAEAYGQKSVYTRWCDIFDSSGLK